MSHGCSYTKIFASTIQELVKPKLCIDISLFCLSVRIYSSLLLDMPIDSLEGRKRTASSQMLCVPFHLQLENNSIGARLAGVANPLYQGYPAQTDKAQPPCPAAESLEMRAVSAQVTLSHNLRCELPHFQEQGGRCTA